MYNTFKAHFLDGERILVQPLVVFRVFTSVQFNSISVKIKTIAYLLNPVKLSRAVSTLPVDIASFVLCSLLLLLDRTSDFASFSFVGSAEDKLLLKTLGLVAGKLIYNYYYYLQKKHNSLVLIICQQQAP